MDIAHRPDSFELVDYVGVIRRRWWIILCATFLGILAAAGYIAVTPKTYVAASAVQVNPTGASSQGQGGSGRTPSSVNMDNEAQLAQSATVSAIAARALHSPLSPDALSKQVSVTVPPNSQVLRITCQAPSAAGAAICANAFANAYLQNRKISATTQINSQLTQLRATIGKYEQQIAKLSTKIASLPENSQEHAADEASLEAARSQLNKLSSDSAALISQLANSEGGSVVSQATSPPSPSAPRKALILPSGLVVGLLLGLILAFAVDRRDKRIYSVSDIERSIDVPVLVDLPRRKRDRTLSLVSSRSRTGQAFSELAGVVTAPLGQGNHVILVTGTTQGPAVSLVATNLAASLARTHADATLVCANLRGTASPDLLGLDEGLGLADVLLGTATVSEVIRRPKYVRQLRVVTPGRGPNVGIYEFQREPAQRLIAELRKESRYVVIEAQAYGESADLFALAEFADVSLIVVEVSGTRKTDAAGCVRRLGRLNAPVLGAVALPVLSRRVTAIPPRPTLPQQQPAARTDAAERTDAAGSAEAADRTEVLPLRIAAPPSGAPASPAVGQGRLRPASTSPRQPGETWPLPRIGVPTDDQAPDQNHKSEDRPNRATGK